MVKIRNSDYCSVSRSELIAIEEGLKAAASCTEYKDIWILTDSRSSIQHIQDWFSAGDRATISILTSLQELSSGQDIYLQWIPSHVGLDGNEMADTLAKEGSLADPSSSALTYLEIRSKINSALTGVWRCPPVHEWYDGGRPGGAIAFEGNRVQQTAMSRLRSGHLKCLKFERGAKVFPVCRKCNLDQLTPDHLLSCLELERRDLFDCPLLVLDFLNVSALMDLI